jgi:hypothetical protein
VDNTKRSELRSSSSLKSTDTHRILSARPEDHNVTSTCGAHERVGRVELDRVFLEVLPRWAMSAGIVFARGLQLIIPSLTHNVVLNLAARVGYLGAVPP